LPNQECGRPLKRYAGRLRGTFIPETASVIPSDARAIEKQFVEADTIPYAEARRSVKIIRAENVFDEAEA
jgi:hypothetical protein